MSTLVTRPEKGRCPGICAGVLGATREMGIPMSREEGDGRTEEQKGLEEDGAMTGLVVRDVKPWSPEDPQLYTVVMELLHGDGRSDRRRILPGGFSVELTKGQLRINDKAVYISVNRHDQTRSGRL